MSIVRESVKTGMAPSIDRTKTVGLVSLPGMMSGLIFAGIDPVQAIRYQIVVDVYVDFSYCDFFIYC